MGHRDHGAPRPIGMTEAIHKASVGVRTRDRTSTFLKFPRKKPFLSRKREKHEPVCAEIRYFDTRLRLCRARGGPRGLRRSVGGQQPNKQRLALR